MSFILDPSKLAVRFELADGTLGNAPSTKRYLSDLRDCFWDTAAFERALLQGNPLVYTVAAIEPAAGDGDLYYALGTIYPGVVGDEYFLTKGHLHKWRAAAEVYVGLAGEGVMLLQDECSGESLMVPLDVNSIVYVPGYTAHRTINVGETPLVYLGVYSARAGHDYKAIADNNFRSIVVKRDGKPCLLPRNES